MVKLVVADDEERVCRLIVALGNWKELGIKVVGTAANGIQELKPAGIQINANIIQNLKRIDWNLYYILE